MRLAKYEVQGATCDVRVTGFGVRGASYEGMRSIVAWVVGLGARRNIQ